MTALPNRNILDGTKLPATTTSEMKTALGSIRDFLSETLGNNSTNPVMTSINGGQLYGLRNLIINGALSIDQRNNGTAKTIVNAASPAYTVDRFFMYVAGANCTGQRIYDAANYKYRYQINGAAEVTSVVFGQRIESQNCYKVVGKTLALSAEITNTTVGTVTWTAYYANATDNFTTSTQIATGTFTGVSATPISYTASFVVPAGGANGIQIQYSTVAQVSGAMSFAEIQLEVTDPITPHATIFEQRPYGLELSLCQRYLPCIQGTGGGDIGQGMITSSSAGIVLYNFKVSPRVLPTGILLGGSGTFVLTTQANLSNVTSITYANSSYEACRLTVVGTGTPYTNGPCILLGGPGANIQFTGCEL